MTLETGTAVPIEFQQLCTDWHGGQDTMLYAVSSTGGVYLGTHRPWSDDEDREYTDTEWEHSLWWDLIAEVRHCKNYARNTDKYSDALKLSKFETYCVFNITRLEREGS